MTGRESPITGAERPSPDEPDFATLLSMMRDIARVAAAALAALAVGASCSGNSAAPASPVALSQCTVAGAAARCGWFLVAENPSDPKGRTISLRVVVLPATGADRMPDPLFYLEGGPGGSAISEAAWVRVHFGVFNRRHDIVLVDQRGTGDSNQAICATPQISLAATDVPTAVEACLASVRAQADPTFYTTPISADDFDAVRAALGYDKVDVYGVSYGVSSGLAYLQRHGAHVRAAVFDSGSLLDYHILESVPRSAQESLALLFGRCRADPACGAAYPHLASDFEVVLSSLSRAPVTVSGVPVALDVNAFLNVVLSGYLAWTPAAAALPRDIHAALAGDWTGVGKTFAAMSAGGSSISIMAVTVRCSDEWASHDAGRTAAIAASSPFTASEVKSLSDMDAICSNWPNTAGAGGRVKSSVPIVFLNSTGDPVDPPENVAGAAADMPNSLVVPVQGTGHWQLDGDTTHCLDSETTAFFELGRKSSPADWVCAASPALPAFALD